MEVKINTREKFHVITLPGPDLAASMTEELSGCLLPYLQTGVKNVVLNMQQVQSLDNKAAETLVNIQQNFYEQNASFVICCLQKPVEQFLDKQGLLKVMNITPTESEAWDIVQMEEIEREFLDDENL
ncbi:MAG: anti-anti-sigma factor [Chitinophagaceae bacterium]